MKKYNVVKCLNATTIPVITGVPFQDACQELESINEAQKGVMFQDTGDVNYSLDLPFFVVYKNGAVIQYQIEVDQFNEMAMLCKKLDLTKQINKIAFQN